MEQILDSDVITENAVKRVKFDRRLGALALDIFFAILIGGILSLIFYSNFSASANITGAQQKLTNLFYPLLIAIFEVAIGASPGKYMLGIVIANKNGTQASKGILFRRMLMKNSGTILSFISGYIIISFLPGVMILNIFAGLFSIAYFIGCFFALDKNRQALHDRLSGTAIFYRKDLVS